ncbi:MAG TPA: (2Fe-2S)-binding protein [Tepidisphaeraceae bacterium]|nr:(2Fe-2S)-binding protein [Tepidisphaeraceae bacterium]
MAADEQDEPAWGMSRRRFLKGVGVVGAGAAIADPDLLRAQDQPPASAAAQPAAATDGPTKITLAVNGQKIDLTAEPRVTLLSALRDYAEPAVTGPKLVCGMGTCGACTVLLDGKPVYSCLCLAADVQGKKIITAEGLGTPEKMNPVQEQFCEKDALMCGFCTPGFVTALSATVEKTPNATVDQIKQGCAGNFCRCGTYPRVFEAAVAAAKA